MELRARRCGWRARAWAGRWMVPTRMGRGGDCSRQRRRVGGTRLLLESIHLSKLLSPFPFRSCSTRTSLTTDTHAGESVSEKYCNDIYVFIASASSERASKHGKEARSQGGKGQHGQGKTAARKEALRETTLHHTSQRHKTPSPFRRPPLIPAKQPSARPWLMIQAFTNEKKGKEASTMNERVFVPHPCMHATTTTKPHYPPTQPPPPQPNRPDSQDRRSKDNQERTSIDLLCMHFAFALARRRRSGASGRRRRQTTNPAHHHHARAAIPPFVDPPVFPHTR